MQIEARDAFVAHDSAFAEVTGPIPRLVNVIDADAQLVGIVSATDVFHAVPLRVNPFSAAGMEPTSGQDDLLPGTSGGNPGLGKELLEALSQKKRVPKHPEAVA